MKKVFLTLLFLAGISQSVNATNQTVTTGTFQTSTTNGNWTTVRTYTYIDFNGNGMLDQWETCVLTSTIYIENLGGGKYWMF